MNSTLLSVVIPVYNIEKYLNNCIESVIRQNLAWCEVILVDDGSTDSSGRICDEYSEKYPNIKTIHKKNGGLSDARNTGIKAAKGEYILFLDGDDCFYEETIDSIYPYLNEKNDVFASDYRSFDGSRFKDYCYSVFPDVVSGMVFLEMQYSRRTMLSSAVQNIYKRDFLISNNLFFKEGIFHEDEEWVPRVFEKANTVKYLPVCFYKYLIREGSIMKSSSYLKHFIDFSETYEALLEHFDYCRLENKHLYSLLKDDLTDKYLSVYARGQLFRDKTVKTKAYSQLSGHLVFAKTKIKVILFSISKRLFCYVSKVINKK